MNLNMDVAPPKKLTLSEQQSLSFRKEKTIRTIYRD